MVTKLTHRKVAAIWRRFRHLIWAAAYCALIVYGSLYPFADWQKPHHLPFLFLFQPWPPFVTRTDVLTNVMVYLPLGFFLFRATRGMLLIPILYGVLLSFLMEAFQTFVPGRVSSNLDILANGAGTYVGAALAWWIGRQAWPCQSLTAWRAKWFLPGRTVNSGLLLLGLWALSQWSLQLPSLVAGNLHSQFSPYWETLANPSRFKIMEALIYLLEITGLGLFVATLLREGSRKAIFMMALVVVAVLFKLLAAAFLIKLALLPRLISLEVIVGLSAGLFFLLILQRDGRGALYLPAMAMLASLAIAKAAYWSADMATGKVFLGGMFSAERLFNITGLAYVVSEIWPLLAIGYLLMRWYVVRDRFFNAGKAG